MKSAEQIKGAVKNIAKKTNLKPQEILQIYMFKRLVERLSVSKYKENFILKGGLLIASMIGIAERTTMDMDTTIQGLPMTEKDMHMFCLHNLSEENCHMRDYVRNYQPHQLSLLLTIF